MNPQTFSIEAEQSFLGALMCDGADAMARVECEVTPAHFYRQDHGRIYAAARKLVDAGRSADSIAVSDALEEAGDLQSVGGLGYVSSLQASSYSSAGVRRHAEIIVERAAIRSLLAVSGQIADMVAEPGQSTQEKIDAAQRLVMGLSDRATLGASEPKTVAELMPSYLDAIEERWAKKGGGMDTGFPDFDKRLNGGFAEGNFVVLAGRPAMGKAQPLESKVLLADGTWKRMGDMTIGDALASVDGAESHVSGVFPQGIKKVFDVTFSDGRSTIACAEHLWRVMYRDWSEPRVMDTEKLRQMLGKKRYKNRLSIDVVSGDFGGGSLPLDPYVLGVLLGDGCMTGGTVRLASADSEIVDEVQRRLGGASDVRKSYGKYDYRIVSKNAEGRAFEDGCRLPWGRRYPEQLNHNNLHMHRPKISYPVRSALVELGLMGLGSNKKFIPDVYFSASKEDRIALLCGLMDTDGWAEAHGSVRFTSSSRVLSEGVQRLVRSLGGLCSIVRKETSFVSRGERRVGLDAWVCRIRHERAEEFFLLERKSVRARRTKNMSVRLNVAKIEERGEMEAQCIQVSHPGRLYVTDEYTVTHNTALGLQIAYHFARQGRGALVCSQEMQSIQLMDRVAAFVGRINLGRVIKGDMSDDESGRFHEAVSSIFNIPLSFDEQGSLKMDDVRRKARKAKGKHGLSVLVIDYLQLMVGDGENRTRELTQITGALKALAKELRICVIALSQLNRAVEQRPNRRPIMADLRESGSIEQDADVIIAPYRDEYYNEDSPHKGLAELLILKNRQGASGGFVPLAYQGEYTRFDSMYGAWPDGEGRAEGKRTRRGFDG